MVHITIGNGTGNGRAMPTLAENWNQTGPVSVVTYTNCDSVDLYVNTTKIGTKKSSDFAENGIMQWTDVPWQSGAIRAVGWKDGKEAAVDSLKTIGAPAKVVLKPDRTALHADGDDVSCIEVDIGDADNNSIFTADNTVQFTMTGPARSLGIASGDWTNDQPFKATSRKAYQGKALIVIQSTLVPGTISLTVDSPGLKPSTLTLTTH
jgi:beta-galactosidase